VADPESAEIYGNSSARQAILRLLNQTNSIRSVVLSGIGHVGKRTFLEQNLNEFLSESDLRFIEPTIDGVREAIEFLGSHPLFSPYRAVYIDDADSMGEPAQDAMLKVLEEPSSSSRIFLICEDSGVFSAPIRNRFEYEVRWIPLSDAEMHEFAQKQPRLDEDLIHLCRGRPGFYTTFLADNRYIELHRLCIRLLTGKEDPVLCRIPDLVSSTKGARSLERDALCHIIAGAAAELRVEPLARPGIQNFLRLASDLQKVPSLNAEIHWQKACLHLKR
jgi:hypothetical protein